MELQNLSIQWSKKENELEITLPYYFPDSTEPLTIVAVEVDGDICLHDRGRAMKELKKRTQDRYTYEDVANYFSRVWLSHPLKDGEILYSYVNDLRDLWRFVQGITLVANADLYPQIDEDYYEMFQLLQREEEPVNLTDGCYPEKFAEVLKDIFEVQQEETYGTLIKTDFYFDGEPCPMWLRLLKDDKGDTYITDFGNYDGGRLLERMEWLNEEVDLSHPKVQKICGRFEACIQEKTVMVKEDVFAFIQLASILGEIGHYIKL